MDAKQYRAALAKLKLSQLRAGKLLGVGPRTSRRWALNEARIPSTAAALIRLALKKRITVADIEAVME